MVTALDAPSGSHILAMDSAGNGNFARNEATLTLNLTASRISHRLSLPAALALNENAGAATVTLTALPPSSDLTVTPMSSQAGLLAVPASIVVPAGQTAATFAVTLAPRPRGWSGAAPHAPRAAQLARLSAL